MRLRVLGSLGWSKFPSFEVAKSLAFWRGVGGYSPWGGFGATRGARAPKCICFWGCFGARIPSDSNSWTTPTSTSSTSTTTTTTMVLCLGTSPALRSTTICLYIYMYIIDIQSPPFSAAPGSWEQVWAKYVLRSWTQSLQWATTVCKDVGRNPALRNWSYFTRCFKKITQEGSGWSKQIFSCTSICPCGWDVA